MSRIDTLKEAIKNKNKEETLSELGELHIEVRTDDELMNSVVSPAVITELHELLISELGVNPRLMQLRNRVPNARKRAMLFVQAMSNGVNYLT